MNNYYIFCKEVMEILNVKEAKAYKIIRQMNDELEKKGFIVVAGRVPRKYFFKRVGVEL